MVWVICIVLAYLGVSILNLAVLFVLTVNTRLMSPMWYFLHALKWPWYTGRSIYLAVTCWKTFFGG